MLARQLFIGLVCLLPITSQSFVPQKNVPSRRRLLHDLQSLNQAPISTLENLSVEETSDELISLLIGRKKGSSGKGDSGRIEDLVESLVRSRVSFDPAACLDGPLFASTVIAGPPPLWEIFGISSPLGKNLQGQQYRYDEKGEKSVINYAEVFGEAFHVRAYGTYERDTASSSTGAEPSVAGAATSPLDGFLSIFQGPQKSSPLSSKSITCPADFTVKVTKGSIFLLGNRIIDIPIKGTGYLRVLYADPSLRIFVSPKSTTDDRWEKAGLMVAQVRVDLVDPAFGTLS